jgi:hypothetical protein
MQIQTRIFRWPEKGNHVIMIARGTIDAGGLERIFCEVASATRFLPDAKVLIDLVDVTFELEPAGIDGFVNRLKLDPWLHKNKIALVSTLEAGASNRLHALSICLSNRGLKVVAFRDSKAAVDWLTEPV